MYALAEIMTFQKNPVFIQHEHFCKDNRIILKVLSWRGTGNGHLHASRNRASKQLAWYPQ